MQLRSMRDSDIPQILEIWNACVQNQEVLFYPMNEAEFRSLFQQSEGWNPECLLVACENERILGFLHAVAPGSFRGSRPGQAYLTDIMVRPEARKQGVGQALIQELKARMRGLGAQEMVISSLNPVNLPWRIPGTAGHDHNNSPGLDLSCHGAGFLQAQGFNLRVSEIAMYLDLTGYRPLPDLEERRNTLRKQGIETGAYDPGAPCRFDRMCDRVGSEYWRDVLRTETQAWADAEPNHDIRFWPDGVKPEGPRPILCAVCDGEMVGFTGPVDRQKSGRGWFTGICTDPEFEKRGIATVLFSLLMQAFVEEHAAFSTLFTGKENHARKVYERVGFRPVREFGIMTMKL